MKILITSAALDFPMELARSLSKEHEITLTDRNDISTDLTFVRNDLDEGSETDGLVRGMDAVIHCGQGDARAGTAEHLDYLTRCTYNLLYAASAAGVGQLIYLSSLEIMEKYATDLAVTEHWRPVPTTELEVLACHLGEFTCREFVRHGRITVVCLRLGDVIRTEEEAANVSAPLHLEDAIQAVKAALSWDASRERPCGDLQPAAGDAGWGLFHIQSPVPEARFSTRSAREYLDYKPAFTG